ncbi:hypothetical protein [Afifella sp. IM 167]|uniref:hypothetical protein n=1 Tax=Afifella sp. IM 167 TaxID=2033586 RepID=UPI001CCB74A3|nr:hypothetical protein [Afifella sp. IM 167]MBZ8132745.1 hypothetical protein [Afifella sp. IM 167]
MTRPPANSAGKDDDLRQRLARLGEEVLAEDVPERLLQALAQQPDEKPVEPADPVSGHKKGAGEEK